MIAFAVRANIANVQRAEEHLATFAERPSHARLSEMDRAPHS